MAVNIFPEPTPVPTGPTFIAKDTMRRIISDVKELRKNPLISHGIYYEHDDTDLLKGKALIIGPADTPYADGFYLFKFNFPTNYPHTPPTVEYCTNDGVTRFNPNLYRCGKVCLSILNTWQGEKWSGCQTISSVLLALCTVLNEAPLLNEPGVTKTHRDFAAYNEILHYKNIEVAIFGMLENERIKADFAIFQPVMHEYFQKNKEKIRLRIETGAIDKEGELIMTGMYQLHVILNYKSLLLGEGRF
jgi:ubiquitin-protein ligase